MKTDVHGCSTCQKGQESYEEFIFGGKIKVQYDYRTEDSKLFSCIAKTLEEARAKRDAWLQLKKKTNPLQNEAKHA